MRGVLAALVLAGEVSVFAAPALAAPATLEPYQMVRSLQLIQDRMADGDAAALPMQRKLLEIIDKALRDAKPFDFEERRNVRAFFIYAMSGGNPATVQSLMPHLDLDEGERNLGRGIVSYLKTDFGAARDYLSAVDPLSLAPELGAFTALVKGAVLTPEDPAAALRMLDEARLLGPGTLVEEAALRRTITLSAELNDTERFLRASSQYVRRFLGSPYASQFADAFIAAVVKLRDTVNLGAVETVVSGMNDDQAYAIYLRLARQSAIEGYEKLLDFASARAARFSEPGARKDPRVLLYSSIASVTSDNVSDVLERLDALDRSRLSAADQKLLDAARAVAREVTAGFDPGDGKAGKEGGSPTVMGTAMPEAGTGDTAGVTPAAGVPGAGESRVIRETHQVIVSTHEKLDEIDRLLQEDAQ